MLLLSKEHFLNQSIKLMSNELVLSSISNVKVRLYIAINIAMSIRKLRKRIRFVFGRMSQSIQLHMLQQYRYLGKM